MKNKIIPHILKNVFLFLGIASIIYKSFLSVIACIILYSILEIVCKIEDGKWKFIKEQNQFILY